MLHIALCDDNPASIEILEKYFDILNDSTIDYDVYFSDVYFSAEELYRYKLNNELTYDIYILDIEMQGMNGLELAKTIRTNEPNALIIFLTSYSEYVFDVFEVITFDFLLKPITFKRFQKVLQKASTYLNMNKKLFSFSYCKKNFSIPCSEIMYIDKSGRKAFLHTPKSTYTLNMTLSNILTHVDPNLFGKIRSSCIVNLEYVQEVVRDELLLKNGESLFVSRNYRHTIKSQHLNFIRNHF